MKGGRGRRAVLAGVALAASVAGATEEMRLLVSGLTYDVVWASAIEALGARYPLAKVGEGVVFTARVERPPRPESAPWEAGTDRVAERVTLWVEPFGDRLTQLRVRIEAEGRRGGAWAPLTVGEAATRDLLAYLRDARSGR